MIDGRRDHPSYALRLAHATDQPMLSRFMASLQDVEHLLHSDRPPGAAIAQAHIAYLLEECSQHNGQVLIAETSQGTPVGFILYMVEDLGGHYIDPDHRKVGWISDIWIEPPHRGQGVLDLMLAAAEEHFRTLGITRLMLAFLQGNAAARQAYERRNFKTYESILERRIPQ